MKKVRKLYASGNGDCWSLIAEPTGAVFVRHEGNVASGGHVQHLDIATFFAQGEGPEQRELLRLIGTLSGEKPHWT